MKIIEVKCWPEFFEAIWLGIKTFDVRKNDRDYRAGDVLVLNEWNPSRAYEVGGDKSYHYCPTGRRVRATIDYVLSGGSPPVEMIPADVVILGIRVLQKEDDNARTQAVNTSGATLSRIENILGNHFGRY